MKTSNKSKVWKIFVSSTYEDMIPFREAVLDAITGLEQSPIGMEHFVSSSEKSLDVCLSDVRRCNLYVLLVGMRYGSIDEETGKSFTELEYEEALRNNIPVLPFVIDENECPVLPKFVDDGSNAEKLRDFKKRLNSSHLVSRFKSADDLKQLVIRSVEKQIQQAVEKETEDKITSSNENVLGIDIYRKFILLPERYKNKIISLRIRIDGTYGSWQQRDDLFLAYGLAPGDTLRINDVTPLGVELSDINSGNAGMDLFAEGKMADWILDTGVTRRSVVEGKFKLLYENVRNITPTGDAKIAALLIIEGKKVINPTK